ncbi:MAG: VWA domain-containing protein [Acidipila sp.]|nr:VWA domain-containing protein [Acidipila sp.]
MTITRGSEQVNRSASQFPACLAAALAAGLLSTVGFLLPARAQAPEGPIQLKPGATIKPPPQGKIRVQVELVSTPVTVRDHSGDLVLTLEQKDFRILDNGVEQKLQHFDLGGDPLSVVVLFETSSRIEPLLPAVRKSAILFSQVVMGTTGEAAVVEFDDHAEVRVPFTRDGEAIESGVKNLRLGTSGTVLYDALSKAVSMLEARPRERRRVVLVVAEAADTGSETKLGGVLRAAELANVTIYSVGLSTTATELRAKPKDLKPSGFPPGVFPMPGPPGQPQTPTTEEQRREGIDFMALAVWLMQHAEHTVKDNALEIATAGTGGMHVATIRDRSIEKAIDQIAAELHAQYTIAYRPTGAEPSGFHNIKVEVTRPGVSVRSRPGYYLPPPEN